MNSLTYTWKKDTVVCVWVFFFIQFFPPFLNNGNHSSGICIQLWWVYSPISCLRKMLSNFTHDNFYIDRLFRNRLQLLRINLNIKSLRLRYFSSQWRILYDRHESSTRYAVASTPPPHRQIQENNEDRMSHHYLNPKTKKYSAKNKFLLLFECLKGCYKKLSVSLSARLDFD